MSTPETALYTPPADFAKNAAVSGFAAYEALCKQAEQDYEGFWAAQAKRLLSWKKPFTKILNESNAPFFKWFEDGTLNASYNSRPMAARWYLPRRRLRVLSPAGLFSTQKASPAGWMWTSNRSFETSMPTNWTCANIFALPGLSCGLSGPSNCSG